MIITQEDRFFNYRLRAFYMLISLLNLDNSSFYIQEFCESLVKFRKSLKVERRCNNIILPDVDIKEVDIANMFGLNANHVSRLELGRFNVAMFTGGRQSVDIISYDFVRSWDLEFVSGDYINVLASYIYLGYNNEFHELRGKAVVYKDLKEKSTTLYVNTKYYKLEYTID